MPNLTHHIDIKYDFTLVLREPPFPKIGDTIKSGVTDDEGQTLTFHGSACVVALQEEWMSPRKVTAYALHYPPI